MTEGHALEEDSGDRSPLGKLYELDGHVLLLVDAQQRQPKLLVTIFITSAGCSTK